MATPTYATALSQINTFIVSNNNNEITANVLNPVLKVILDFANNNIGDLATLTTDEKNSIVQSINSLKQNFEDLVNSGVQLHTGINNPNTTPPATYNYADFYMQLDVDSLPVKLWQWNGFVWTDESTSPEIQSDDVINNSDVEGITVTNALDFINVNFSKKILYWSAGTYNNNDLVKKSINSQVYLFASTEDSNTTEPFLNSEKTAWSLSPYGGLYVGVWSAGAYVTGNIVSRNNYIYYCLTNNSTDPELLISPNWIKLGFDRGLFFSGYVGGYFNGDVVRDGSNIVYISNYSQNSYALNYGVVSKWKLINGQPNTIICWGDSLTAGTGSTGIGNYPAQFSFAGGINIDNKGVPGETSTQIKTRFLAEPDKWKNPIIIWAGRNNWSSPTTVKADIAEMVSKIPHDRYLILGIIKATNEMSTTIETLNADLKTIYGDRFVNIQDYLLTIYNPAISQDVTDHTNNVIAWSLRSDWLHLNNLGYFYVAKAVSTRSNILLGKDYLFQTNIETSGLRVTGNTAPNQNTIGLELLYRADLNKGIIQSYNRVTSALIPTSIGYSVGSSVYLIEQGGSLVVGTSTPSTAPNNTVIGLNNGSNIQSRTSVPQLVFSSNADGDWYNSTYKISSKFAAQIFLSGDNGTIGFRNAVSGTAGGAITWLDRLFIAASGGISIGNTTDAGANNLNIVGKATAGVAASSANDLMRKGEVDTALALKANLASPTLTGTPTAPTATAGTNTTQVATTAFVQAATRPYKVYTALLSQSGTSAPTGVVLENTLGGTITFSRTVAGNYLATLTGAFISNKTACFITATTGTFVHQAVRNSINDVVIITLNNSNIATDSLLSNTTFEVRVYN